MENIRFFTPHVIRHPEFAAALYKAHLNGVEVLAYTCRVTEDTLSLEKSVPVYLTSDEVIKNHKV